MNRVREVTEAGAALRRLDGLQNFERSGHLAAPTTDRVATLVEALGNPHRAYPVVHVTGTNGKGSVTAMISALLAGEGLRVGTYTSPHLVDLTERVTVAGEPVTEEELEEAVDRVLGAATAVGVTPTWFEALTAAALWLLAAREVDVAVVEVGMLGRWDATNVVDGTVAVVTNVELDHTDLAGPTRAAIAAEKAGIVTPGSTLVLGEPDPELRGFFTARDPARILTAGRELTWRNRHRVRGGSLVDLVTPWGTHDGVSVAMAGAHQCDNAVIALGAAEAFLGSALTAATVSSALGRTHVPGRFELVGARPAVVLDGAHNPAAATALRLAVAETFPGVTPTVLVIGALTGRDPVEFLDRLGAGSADLVVATRPASPRALPARDLADAARTFGVRVVEVDDPERALVVAMSAAGPDGVVVATGSLYLLGALRAALTRHPDR